MNKEQEENLRKEFQEFADSILWSNDSGDEKYIGVGNMADWWINKIKQLMKIDRKQFESVVIGHTNDITYLLHTVLSLMRRMNRDGKLEDYEFAMLHNTIDLCFKKQIK